MPQQIVSFPYMAIISMNKSIKHLFFKWGPWILDDQHQPHSENLLDIKIHESHRITEIESLQLEIKPSVNSKVRILYRHYKLLRNVVFVIFNLSTHPALATRTLVLSLTF